jgi:hypothetical protein
VTSGHQTIQAYASNKRKRGQKDEKQTRTKHLHGHRRQQRHLARSVSSHWGCPVMPIMDQLDFLIISQAGGVAMTIPPSRLMVAEIELMTHS